MMSMRYVWLAVVGSLPLVGSVEVRAQSTSGLPPRIAEALQAEAARVEPFITVVNGKVSPERLSLAAQMRGLLTTIAGAPQLRHLTDEDAKILHSHAEQEFSVMESIRQDVRSSFSATCGKRKVMNAISLATAFQRMDEEEDTRFSDYYRSVLDSLSASGKAAVLNYLATEVAPYTVKSSIDYVGLAGAAPEQVQARVAAACANNGRSPSYGIGTIER